MAGRAAIVGLVLVAAACRSGAPPQSPVAETAPPTPGETTVPSPVQAEMCRLVTVEDMASIAGQPAAIDAASSNVATCTYVFGASSASPSYEIALRTEDVFDGLATAKAAFAGGQDVPDLGDGAYWSPTVETLWFKAGDSLLAVQLLGFDPQGNALAIARAVAEAALGKM